MTFAKSERKWAERTSGHLKAEPKRAAVTYDELEQFPAGLNRAAFASALKM